MELRQQPIVHPWEQNGVAERANQTIKQMTKCILQRDALSKSFWDEAVNKARTACT